MRGIYQYALHPECDLMSLQQTQYGNPMIYVTENGVSEKMVCTDLCDDWRMQYFKDYINEMLKGIKTLLDTEITSQKERFYCLVHI